MKSKLPILTNNYSKRGGSCRDLGARFWSKTADDRFIPSVRHFNVKWKNVRAEMENYIFDFEGFLVSELTKKCVGTSHYWPKLKKM